MRVKHLITLSLQIPLVKQSQTISLFSPFLSSHSLMSSSSSSSSSSSTKKKLLQTVAVDLGCSCGRPKLSTIFWPKSKSKSKPKYNNPKPKHYHSSSSSLGEEGGPNEEEDSTTTFSPKFDSTSLFSESEDSSSRTINGFSRIGESVAVVKDSNDPYLDFRNSMLQMILEKEIYSKEDLRELLDCFLSLNSPYHHEIILQVFREICNGVSATGHDLQKKQQGYFWNARKGKMAREEF